MENVLILGGAVYSFCCDAIGNVFRKGDRESTVSFRPTAPSGSREGLCQIECCDDDIHDSAVCEFDILSLVV